MSTKPTESIVASHVAATPAEAPVPLFVRFAEKPLQVRSGVRAGRAKVGN